MRARILKPSFFTSDQLAPVSPWARLLFQGLWCIADRSGRLEDRPLRLKAEVFPYDAVDCDEMLGELADAGVIQRYEVGGVRLIQIPAFERHQHPHPNEPESKLPPPSDEPLHVMSTRDMGVSARAVLDPDPDPVIDHDPDRVIDPLPAREPLNAAYEGLANLVTELCGFAAPSHRVSEQLLDWAQVLSEDDVGRIRTEVGNVLADGVGRRGNAWRLIATIAGRVSVDRLAGRDPWAIASPKPRRPPNAMPTVPAQLAQFRAVVVTGLDAEGKPVRGEALS